MKKFPKQFLWGGAVSNVQAEGAYLADGKGLNVYDTLNVRKETGQKNVEESEPAANHYYQFEEDIELMKKMSFRAYRFSIVWSRIHPKGIEEEPNEAGLQYYETMIDRLLEAGIEPVVSLVHFDMPDYLAKEYNGFYSREVVDFYARHVEAVAERFKDKVKYWITYNEMNLAVRPGDSRLVAGALRPEGVSLQEFYRTIVHHTQLAHARALLIIKAKNPKAQVSGMIGYTQVYPKTDRPKDIQAARIWNNYYGYLTFDIMTSGEYPSYYKAFLHNRGLAIPAEEDFRLIKEAAGKIDFLSVSYYQTNIIEGPETEDPMEFEDEVIFHARVENSKYLETTDWGWTINPDGLRDTLSSLYQRYKKPIFIVENGIGMEEIPDENRQIKDYKRIHFYKSHIKKMKEAMDFDGVQVLGYLAWAPIDFLSSHKEMRKRYGFIYIDTGNQKNNHLERIPKESFSWYKKVIESDGGIIYEE